MRLELKNLKTKIFTTLAVGFILAVPITIILVVIWIFQIIFVYLQSINVVVG